MIRVSGIHLPYTYTREDLEEALRSALGISSQHPLTYTLRRRALDARRKNGAGLFFDLTVDAQAPKEEKIMKRLSQKHKGKGRTSVQYFQEKPSYQPPALLSPISPSPIVVGMGPCGLFCALTLARAGLRPLIVERGEPVEARNLKTRQFFEKQLLDPESNIQFGEGGAGTYSDGKVNTLVKDPSGRSDYVLEELHRAGAPEEILYESRPHIGTDLLQKVIRNLREELLALGCEILFSTKLTDLFIEEGRVKAAVFTDRKTGQSFTRQTSALFLGIGHSARDTYAMLEQRSVPMEEKPFALGLRIEHPQSMIDLSQYHDPDAAKVLGPASYKLAATVGSRGVYSFCMCPGGQVVAGASEEESIVTNGMSSYRRDRQNANAALLVTVDPGDFAPYRKEGSSLSGMFFQRALEHQAFLLGGADYSAPLQRVDHFLSASDQSGSFGEVLPDYTGKTAFANLWDLLPEYICQSLREGIRIFGRRIEGFDRPDALLTGVESRSSSPVRILRDDSMQSRVLGLYPMGEGAGYAGGILSAAMDGIKAAEAFIEKENQKG